VIKFSDARLAFAQAIYDLLSKSDEQEWFSVSQISERAGLEVGGAFAGRVLTLSQEEDEIFQSTRDEGEEFWTLGKEGFELVEAHQQSLEAAAEAAPASDRVVRFNHNAPDAQQIAEQLAEVRESVRGANGPDIDEQERGRVFEALTIAEEIWKSSNFKLIQLKVGVLLAVEDAAALLAKTAKNVAAALLVDAIKSFVKTHFHTDLDAI